MRISVIVGAFLGRLYRGIKYGSMSWVNWLTGLWAFGIGIRMTYELLEYGSFTVKGIVWLDWVPLAFLGVITFSSSLANLINRLFEKGG